MVPAVVFEFCVMRCQPLSRALYIKKDRGLNDTSSDKIDIEAF